jgi:Ca2+:H+ antiporter
VIPFLVLVGWLMGKPMSLAFPVFEVVIFVLSVIITVPILLSGSSHWLLGSMLITSYAFVAFAFWFERGHGTDDV